jgi:hypothetical protein
LGKSDISTVALRHDGTVKQFASLPQAVQQRVWNDEFVPAFWQSLQNDPVGSALIGWPAIAKRRRVDLVTHGRDGPFRRKDSYGKETSRRDGGR